MGMCSRSLTHAQTIGAAALLAAEGRLRHMTLYNANKTNKTNKTGRDIPPGAYRQLQAAERTGLVKHEKPHRVGAEMRCRDQGLQPTRRAHHHVAPTTQTTGTWCPSRRQPLPIPFVLAVSLARVYMHHPAAMGVRPAWHGQLCEAGECA